MTKKEFARQVYHLVDNGMFEEKTIDEITDDIENFLDCLEPRDKEQFAKWGKNGECVSDLPKLQLKSKLDLMQAYKELESRWDLHWTRSVVFKLVQERIKLQKHTPEFLAEVKEFQIWLENPIDEPPRLYNTMAAVNKGREVFALAAVYQKELGLSEVDAVNKVYELLKTETAYIINPLKGTADYFKTSSKNRARY